VVGALTGHGEPPDERARLDVDGHHVGQARPGHDQQLTVRRGVHVVDQLVVPLADERAHGQEVEQPHGVQVDLDEPLVEVGHHVDRADVVERGVRGDDVHRAVPVVADEQHVPDGCGLGRRRWSEEPRRHDRHQRQRGCPLRHDCSPKLLVGKYSHHAERPDRRKRPNV
jgi:hypothetical protein